MKKKILITTAIDYVNDVIHIGHAYQKILADSIARYYRASSENEVYFLTGTDEHGSKSEEAARAEGVEPKEFTDKISALDQAELDALNISYDRFIRTTDPDHYEVAKDFYQKSFDNGDIFLDEYTGLYCIGCEEFKKSKDLVNGKCPNHPTKEISTVTEKNYFFRWSKYADFLKEWITSGPWRVQHDARRNEMLAFIEQGIEDIPISRATVNFGIPVPNDSEGHVLYVWFDALINYITGKPEYWEDDETQIIHILGKDNVRWHALLWPAMLKSAGYRLPNTVYGHDFFTIDGQKISKSLGNIVRPTELVEKYGADAVRYYFLRYGPIRDDVDVTIDELERIYNADLANGLGNLIARVAKMAEKADLKFETDDIAIEEISGVFEYIQQMKIFRVDLVLEFIWKKIQNLDQYIDKNRVWEQTDNDKQESLRYLVREIREISILLQPFLPNAAGAIAEQFFKEKIHSQKPLFPRITPLQ